MKWALPIIMVVIGVVTFAYGVDTQIPAYDLYLFCGLTSAVSILLGE